MKPFHYSSCSKPDTSEKVDCSVVQVYLPQPKESSFHPMWKRHWFRWHTTHCTRGRHTPPWPLSEKAFCSSPHTCSFFHKTVPQMAHIYISQVFIYNEWCSCVPHIYIYIYMDDTVGGNTDPFEAKNRQKKSHPPSRRTPARHGTRRTCCSTACQQHNTTQDRIKSRAATGRQACDGTTAIALPTYSTTANMYNNQPQSQSTFRFFPPTSLGYPDRRAPAPRRHKNLAAGLGPPAASPPPFPFGP